MVEHGSISTTSTGSSASLEKRFGRRIMAAPPLFRCQTTSGARSNDMARSTSASVRVEVALPRAAWDLLDDDVSRSSSAATRAYSDHTDPHSRLGGHGAGRTGRGHLQGAAPGILVASCTLRRHHQRPTGASAGWTRRKADVGPVLSTAPPVFGTGGLGRTPAAMSRPIGCRRTCKSASRRHEVPAAQCAHERSCKSSSHASTRRDTTAGVVLQSWRVRVSMFRIIATCGRHRQWSRE